MARPEPFLLALWVAGCSSAVASRPPSRITMVCVTEDDCGHHDGRLVRRGFTVVDGAGTSCVEVESGGAACTAASPICVSAGNSALATNQEGLRRARHLRFAKIPPCAADLRTRHSVVVWRSLCESFDDRDQPATRSYSATLADGTEHSGSTWFAHDRRPERTTLNCDDGHH